MQRSGDMAGRLVADVETLDGLYLRLLAPLAAAIVLFLILLVALVAEGGALWPAGLAATGLFAIAAFVVPAVSARSSGDPAPKPPKRPGRSGLPWSTR